jgi:TrmH family RNA methyltransferase
MITSTNNPKVKWVHKLQSHSKARRSEEAFVLEGVRLTEEGVKSGWETRLVFYTKDLDQRGKKVLDRYFEVGVLVQEVSPQVMSFISDTDTPQGILSVVTIQSLPISKRIEVAFIPDSVRDPGNLGTMLRTGAAAGVGVIYITPGTVDPYTPKVVRAAMGAHFRVPIQLKTWNEIDQIKRALGLMVYLADINKGKAFNQVTFKFPMALVVGGEAKGASTAARSLVDEYVHIPMFRGVESLNAAVASGILLFEVFRKRKKLLPE